jgi:hypothetical protein
MFLAPRFTLGPGVWIDSSPWWTTLPASEAVMPGTVTANDPAWPILPDSETPGAGIPGENGPM